MRRIVLLGLLLVVSGCADYVGSPFDGADSFLSNTHTFSNNPNRPVSDGDTMRRVMGQEASLEPLVPEPGNVWPGPIMPEPTMADLVNMTPEQLERQGSDLGTTPGAPLSPPRIPSNVPRGSSTPPTPLSSPMSPPMLGTSPTPRTQAAPPNRFLQTPGGPSVSSSAGGVQTFTDPQGRTGLVVPNGNGTSTLISPDGSVQTVPTPK